MSNINKFFATRWAMIFTGAVIGSLAALLVKWGNPGNMGVCMACFIRDTSGALGLHRVAAVQYIRPEVIGLVLGATIAAILFRDFKARGGSAPLVRFLLGNLAMIGALVFLGCPWRAYLRLSGGDWNAIFGILGLAGGVFLGILFLKAGFSLGRSQKGPAAMGFIFPTLVITLLLLLVFAPLFGRDADGKPIGPIFFSEKGPGALHAPLIISLVVGLVIGLLAQRSRFCTIAGLRDLMLIGDTHFASGILALVVFAFLSNLTLGQFKAGFADQPIAHTNALWNFGGMVLAGLAFTLAGGCPGRQIILAGEGDTDAAIFVFGMLTGAAFSHNFNLASSATGPSPYGPLAVVVGLVIVVLIGLGMRERQVASQRVIKAAEEAKI
jgi:YedE family putative selenium metabolism protein